MNAPLTTRWTLVREAVLEYPGHLGANGVCHVRVFACPAEPPLVIVGELDDNPGTPINVAAPAIAGAIGAQLLDGRHDFRYLEYYPAPDARAVPGWFQEAQFSTRERPPASEDPRDHAGQVRLSLGEDEIVILGPRIPGDFETAHWHSVGDIGAVLPGVELESWAPGAYTAGAVGGPEAHALREHAAQRSRKVERLMLDFAQTLADTIAAP